MPFKFIAKGLHGKSYVRKKRNGRVTIPMDDSRVIPYNPFLTLKYGCHINIEYVFGQKACKYIFKYLLKGIFYFTMFVITFFVFNRIREGIRTSQAAEAVQGRQWGRNIRLRRNRCDIQSSLSDRNGSLPSIAFISCRADVPSDLQSKCS